MAGFGGIEEYTSPHAIEKDFTKGWRDGGDLEFRSPRSFRATRLPVPQDEPKARVCANSRNQRGSEASA